MNILTLVFLILSSFTSEPLEEIAAIKLGRNDALQKKKKKTLKRKNQVV